MNTARLNQIASLTIGITGHRDIDPQDNGLTSLLHRELKDLHEQYPERPFIVVSPLAEGADRLMARAAKEVLDARLKACPGPRSGITLPLPLDDPAGYKMDFSDTVPEFEQLLARE